jgi:hypothetical protein
MAGICYVISTKRSAWRDLMGFLKDFSTTLEMTRGARNDKGMHLEKLRKWQNYLERI